MRVSYLTRIGEQYGGYAALFQHEFSSQHRGGGEIVEVCERTPKKLLSLYGKIAPYHPWAQPMWKEPVGYAIFPDEIKILDKVKQNRNFDSFVRALLRHQIPIGMGAILWKDRNHGPRFVIALGILRSGNPDKGDAFSREDKDLFACLIPTLVQKIQTHDRIKVLLARAVERELSMTDKMTKRGAD